MITLKDKLYIFFKDIFELITYKISQKEKGKIFWGRSPYLDYGPGIRTSRLKYEIEKLSINDVFIYMQSHWPWYEIILYIFFAKLLNIKILFNQNGTFTKTYNKFFWFHNSILLFGIINSNFIIYQSCFCYESILKVCPKFVKNQFDKKKFSILLNPAIKSEVNKTYNNEKSHKIIICKHFNKDISYYSKYIHDLINKIHNKEEIIEINIIGNIQNNLNKEEVKNLNKIKKLKILKYLKNNEILKVLKKSTIVIHLNYGDPCPNFISEAVSLGLPCILNETGGAKEIAMEASITLQNKLIINGFPMPRLDDVIENLEKMMFNYKSFQEFAWERADQLTLRKYALKHLAILNKI